MSFQVRPVMSRLWKKGFLGFSNCTRLCVDGRVNLVSNRQGTRWRDFGHRGSRGRIEPASHQLSL